jgi:hypothetical protein
VETVRKTFNRPLRVCFKFCKPFLLRDLQQFSLFTMLIGGLKLTILFGIVGWPYRWMAVFGGFKKHGVIGGGRQKKLDVTLEALLD